MANTAIQKRLVSLDSFRNGLGATRPDLALRSVRGLDIAGQTANSIAETANGALWTVLFDRETGALVSIQAVSETSIDATMRLLHTGAIGGEILGQPDDRGQEPVLHRVCNLARSPDRSGTDHRLVGCEPAGLGLRSAQIRDTIYPASNEEVPSLGYAYQYEYMGTAELRMKQGGVRLAAYLDWLFRTER